MGRYLAGMVAQDGSPFSDLLAGQPWQDHRREFDALWNKFDQVRRPMLTRFQKSELAVPQLQRPVVFYPFGGPDILTASIFFPSARTFVLVGLEPPGSLPTKELIGKRDPQEYLPRIRRTIYSLLYRSFFVTEAMDKQIRGQITDGVLPLLLIELVRTGHRVLGYQHVEINGEGRLVPWQPGDEPPTSRKNRGVVIEYQADGSKEANRVVYLSVNLHDSAFESNAAFRKYMDGHKPVAAFFKAASYLPHQKGFGQVRAYVLEISSGVIQDDTGIPYRFWDRGKWDVQLYGKYTQPYGSFRFMVQPDLKKAYSEEGASVKPLGFYIGYGYGRAPSAMTRAIRK
ncbi:MAG: hypothetical protein JNL98_33915 [Bryobacterales bacterium]|nr:hypothetical protein [Bryobacterales bacterium]